MTTEGISGKVVFARVDTVEVVSTSMLRGKVLVEPFFSYRAFCISCSSLFSHFE